MLTTAILPAPLQGSFGSGIETSRGTVSWPYQAYVDIENGSIIENATVAYRDYDSDNPNINATSGGLMYAAFSTFRNNIRHLAIYNSFGNGVPINVTTTIGNLNFGALFQYCNFVDTLGFNPPTTPPDMVYLENCSNIIFYSCNFNARTISNSTLIGLHAVAAGFFLQPYPAGVNLPNCTLSGFRTGISVVNNLEPDRVCIVVNTDIDGLYGINMSGCLNPYILNCHFLWADYNSAQYYAGIYLNNCTGYKIEGNQGYSHPAPGCPFAIIRNSGTAYNEIYRNSPKNNEIGIEAMGINRNTYGSTGLKILCNNLSLVFGSGISIEEDPLISIVGGQGVANGQYDYGTVSNPYPISAIVSAGNRFQNRPNYWDFYLGSNTNTQLFYKYNPLGNAEKPIYTNLLPYSIITTPYSNTCPVHNIGSTPPPFPFFASFVQNNKVLETQIKTLDSSISLTSDTVIDATNEAELDNLYTQHALLIDSIINYYQYMGYADTTNNRTNYTDSITLVYQQITVGYEYQIYLASAYACKGQYNNALNVLNTIPRQYNISKDETTYISTLTDMFAVRQWLYQNNNNWDSLPNNLKTLVYQNEQNDPMFAGAMARSLRAQYEGATYDPYYVLPLSDSSFLNFASFNKQIAITNNIYPNPTNGNVWLNWTGGNALLTLYNVTGGRVFQQNVHSGLTNINVSNLPSGTYFAEIQVKGNIQYQQKIVKE